MIQHLREEKASFSVLLLSKEAYRQRSSILILFLVINTPNPFIYAAEIGILVSEIAIVKTNIPIVETNIVKLVTEIPIWKMK